LFIEELPRNELFIEELTREEIEEFNHWKFIMRDTRVFEVVRGEKAAPREEISEKPQEESRRPVRKWQRTAWEQQQEENWRKEHGLDSDASAEEEYWWEYEMAKRKRQQENSEKHQEEIAEMPEPAEDVTQQEQARPRPTARKAPPPRPPLAAVKKEEEILEKREEPKEPEGMGPFEKREEPHEEPQEGRDTWLALLLQAPEGKEPQEAQSAQWTKATVGRTVVAGQSAPRGPQLEQQPQEAPQQEGQEMMSQAVHRWSHENMSTQEVELLII